MALLSYIYMFKWDNRTILMVMVTAVGYAMVFEPSEIFGIFWHFMTASCVVIGAKKFPLLTIILSIYGGITYFAFGFFHSIQNCLTMYVFMTNTTFLGSLCICWMVYPPEILLYKPKYLIKVYNGVMAQFLIMAVSFFLELTVEHPTDRKTIYIEGVSYIFLLMLYFLIKMLLAYYFSFGVVYRHYLVVQISKRIAKHEKNVQDESDIADAVGREVDKSLKDEVIDAQVNIYHPHIIFYRPALQMAKTATTQTKSKNRSASLM